MIEEARSEAKEAAARVVKQAEEQIGLEIQKARQQLRADLAELVLSGVEKVIANTLSDSAK
ncbi:MAG: F0F1 ATP synthase subunit B, partial [Proteobacteria bacterium]|nr:F0F1 ATP synthase subunit B [Pseudomonadota bacterium]